MIYKNLPEHENCEKFTPIGIVEIYDAETGELVYKTHNMIVKSGRSLILNAVFGGASLKKAKFSKFYESGSLDNSVLTTADMALPENIVSEAFNDNDVLDSDNLCMKINLEIKNSAKTVPISAIGTSYDGKLFSRAAIDPVYMRPNRTYKCTYTMYF